MRKHDLLRRCSKNKKGFGLTEAVCLETYLVLPLKYKAIVSGPACAPITAPSGSDHDLSYCRETFLDHISKILSRFDIVAVADKDGLAVRIKDGFAHFFNKAFERTFAPLSFSRGIRWPSWSTLSTGLI